MAEAAFKKAASKLRAHGRAAPHAGGEPFVKTLLEIYEEYTPGGKGECLSTPAAAHLRPRHPRGVAFGSSMPGFVSNLHSANERLRVKDWVLSAKIFAEAIARLCG